MSPTQWQRSSESPGAPFGHKGAAKTSCPGVALLDKGYGYCAAKVELEPKHDD
ncbi:hypothetical protein [Saccharospirillum sp.]|uniref:hypothetical protein n=1 Tax=Saccharospirillum sp. TaxID=2033801 RepID=UPI0034A0675C